MKWVIIKGVRYPMSVVSAFAAYYGNNPFLKIRIRNKYHIISFDNFDYLNIQIRYLINNYPDFVQIGNWYISKKQVMSWGPRGRPWTGRAGSYPFICLLAWRTVLKLSSTRKRSIKEL